MNNQKEFTAIELVVVLFAVCFIAASIWNAVKMTSCDFKSNYKCEVIHGIGIVVPPASIVTVWFGDDGK